MCLQPTFKTCRELALRMTAGKLFQVTVAARDDRLVRRLVTVKILRLITVKRFSPGKFWKCYMSDRAFLGIFV